MIINSTTIQGKSIITNVTYTLDDGSQVTVNVTTVNPKSQDDVLTDLANMLNMFISFFIDQFPNIQMEIEQGKEHDAALVNIKAVLDSQAGQTVAITPDASGKMSMVAQPAQPALGAQKVQ